MINAQNSLKLIRILAWSTVLLMCGGLSYVLLSPKETLQVTAATIGGPFRLIATDGSIVDNAKLAGKPYAIFFGFTNCPVTCPTTMMEISQDMQALGEAAKDFRVYFVTVDPEQDTPAILKEYTGAFDPRIIGLLPKDEEELKQVAKAFRVIYFKVKTPSGYTMDHTASIFLMNARGEFAGTLDSREKPENRQAKLKRLLQG